MRTNLHFPSRLFHQPWVPVVALLLSTNAAVTFSKNPTVYCFSSGLPYGQPFGNFHRLFTQNPQGPLVRVKYPELPSLASVYEIFFPYIVFSTVVIIFCGA